ncbi:hypothetical protein PLANPX_1980 [Lacipirellula parvula]|uniref:Uncharacterized protein n=1 Tax=Lacipirellula parvula TaxID=2650471 RepID=A0A5K7X741_9BACT|nr:hypothetical protein PLANPX_1980 [Lacipirellula parvula]
MNFVAKKRVSRQNSTAAAPRSHAPRGNALPAAPAARDQQYEQP